MGNVLNFTGVTLLDLPAHNVLDKALKIKLDSVVIIGYDKEGNEYFASSLADGSDVVWLLERAKLQLLTLNEEDL